MPKPPKDETPRMRHSARKPAPAMPMPARRRIMTVEDLGPYAPYVMEMIRALNDMDVETFKPQIQAVIMSDEFWNSVLDIQARNRALRDGQNAFVAGMARFFEKKEPE